MSYLFFLFKDRIDYDTDHPIRLIYAKMSLPITRNFRHLAAIALKHGANNYKDTKL
jgi:hypothetical protein